MAIKVSMTINKYDIESMYRVYSCCEKFTGANKFPPLVVGVHLRDDFMKSVFDDPNIKTALYAYGELCGDAVHLWYRAEKKHRRINGTDLPDMKSYYYRIGSFALGMDLNEFTENLKRFLLSKRDFMNRSFRCYSMNDITIDTVIDLEESNHE